MRFTFIGDSEDELDAHGQTCTLDFEATSWPDILPFFRDFLQGCGYELPRDSQFAIITGDGDLIADDEDLYAAMRAAGCCCCDEDPEA